MKSCLNSYRKTYLAYKKGNYRLPCEQIMEWFS